jgi:hypothetical protein
LPGPLFLKHAIELSSTQARKPVDNFLGPVVITQVTPHGDQVEDVYVVVTVGVTCAW